MDVDIQGAEKNVIKSGIEILEKKVKRLHIGTHRLDIHHELLDLFSQRGWQILVQVPPKGKFSTQWGDFQTGDGILSVLNQMIV